MKLIKELKTCIKLKYWIWKSSFINNFHQQGKVMEPLRQLHAQRGGTEIIPIFLISRPGWKNPHIKVVPSRFLSRPGSHINSPLDMCFWNYCRNSTEQNRLLLTAKHKPSRCNPGRREKINLNLYCHISLWCLKRFYEVLKSLHKTFRGTTKNCEDIYLC